MNGDCSHEIKRHLFLGRKAMTNLDSVLKSRDITANKGPFSQNYGFSSSQVRMWQLDHKEDWVLKNWCFWIVVLGKTLKSPLDSKEIKPVNPKGNQSWIFIGSTDAEAETPVLWPPEAKSWFIRKDPNAVKTEDKRRRGTEDEMVGWHHPLNGYEFEQIPGDSEGQGSLACCSPWGCKECNMTEGLNNNNSLVYGPALTSVYDYWTNHSFDYTDLCWQNAVGHCGSGHLWLGMELVSPALQGRFLTTESPGKSNN